MARKKGMAPVHDEHINVTPLIDIVMCLIIFFMICGKLAENEGDKGVMIPKATQSQELGEQKGRLIVNLSPVNRENRQQAPKVVIKGEECNMADLTKKLRDAKRENPDLRLLVRADKELIYIHISPVLVACAQANISSIHFATELE